MDTTIIQTDAAVDVLIITAISLEFDAVIGVDAGTMAGTAWEPRPDPQALNLAFRVFRTLDGRPLRIAVAQAAGMRTEATADRATVLLATLRPRCLAMVGVCAGRPGKVDLGDVIGATLVWHYDYTAISVEDAADGAEIRHTDHETQTYSPPSPWIQALERYVPPDEIADRLQKERPSPLQPQIDWLLTRIADGDTAPGAHPERSLRCPDYEAAVRQAWQDDGSQWLEDGRLKLTEAGLRRVERLRSLYPQGLPNLTKPRLRVRAAPIGTSNQLVRDESVWSDLVHIRRDVIGLEMEAAAIGAVAERNGIRHWLVMKAVMDFAHREKDDRFKKFAACASAECLIDFLRRHLPSSPPPELLDPGTGDLQQDPPPSALLVARHEVVPFLEPGRAEILRDLEQWCGGSDGVAVRLFHGPGGVGKTRLFIEVSRNLRDRAWRAGFLPTSASADEFERLVLTGPMSSFVVIDYAESRLNLDDLLERVARRRDSGGGAKIRVVLLARNAEDWWSRLSRADSRLEQLLTRWSPVEVIPLTPTGPHRGEVFRAAAESFARQRGRKIPSEIPSLQDDIFGRVLYIQMAALAVVDGISFGVDTLMDRMLEHEERFWFTRARSRGLLKDDQADFVRLARDTLTATTLLGGLQTLADADALVRRLHGREERHIIRLLHDLYQRGGRGGSDDNWLGVLDPDLLGESLVCRTLSRTQELPEDYLDRVFDGASDAALRSGFEVFGSVSIQKPQEARGWISRVLNKDVRQRALQALRAAKNVAKKTSLSALGQTLHEALLREGDEDTARLLRADSIPEDSVSLGETAAWIEETLLRALPADDTGTSSKRAKYLANLGVRYRALGQSDKAVAYSEESVALYRRLAADDPVTFEAEMAVSLNILGATYDSAGRDSDALRASEQAVALYRGLRSQSRSSDDLDADFGDGLTGLGQSYLVLDRPQDGLRVLEEAVALFRELDARDPHRFEHRLASSLLNLGRIYGLLDEQSRGLQVTIEAVGLLRRVVVRAPDTAERDLAAGLTNLGGLYRDLRQAQDALPVSLEATALFRRLTLRLPDAFEPLLALSLNNVAATFDALGEPQEAMRAGEEAAGLYRQLAARFPGRFEQALARCLVRLGGRYDAGQAWPDALRTTDEAVTIYRRLASLSPDEFDKELARSLSDLGRCDAALHLSDAAQRATAESVTIYRRLAARSPEEFDHELAMSLSDLTLANDDLNRPAEALTALKDAVDAYRRLATRKASYESDLAQRLNDLAGRLFGLEQVQGALRVIQEGVEVYRRLAARTPEQFEQLLAGNLGNLARCHAALKHHDLALHASEEAVMLHRRLATRAPDKFEPLLAMSLNNLAANHDALEHWQEARTALEEAVTLYRRLAARVSTDFEPELILSLYRLGRLNAATGRAEASVVDLNEALDRIWPHWLATPAAGDQAHQILRLLTEVYAKSNSAVPPVLASRIESFWRARSMGRVETPLVVRTIARGTIQADAANDTTAFKTDLASSVDNQFRDCVIVFTSGTLKDQARKVTAYVGATKIITANSVFATTPAAGDRFILSASQHWRGVLDLPSAGKVVDRPQ